MPAVVVLVRTRNPGNLGACARAAKNFGAALLLLDPRTEVDHPDALAFASGAEDVLSGAPHVPGWNDLARAARADEIVGMTSLRGRLTRGLPPTVAWSALRSSLAAGRRIAFVFGPERGGLTTEELRGCDFRISLPTSTGFATLNVSQAVAAALALTARPRAPRGEPRESPAGSPEMARVLAALRRALEAAGYAGRGRSKDALAELESLIRRARPTRRETTLLLGAVASLDRGIRASEREGSTRTEGRRTGRRGPAR